MDYKTNKAKWAYKIYKTSVWVDSVITVIFAHFNIVGTGDLDTCCNYTHAVGWELDLTASGLICGLYKAFSLSECLMGYTGRDTGWNMQ